MGQRQLNIRSDETYRRASGLAARLGRSTTEVVIDALRTFDASPSAEDSAMMPEQRQRFEQLQNLSARTARHLRPDAPEGRDWICDENGLPR